MEQTIDKKVIDVIKKENRKLSSKQKDYQRVIADIEKLTGKQSDNYTIAPKDTIGKNILFNIKRS